jgi:hypothetical protein
MAKKKAAKRKTRTGLPGPGTGPGAGTGTGNRHPLGHPPMRAARQRSEKGREMPKERRGERDCA